MKPELLKYIKAINKAKKVKPFIGRLLALDPGETTGVCVIDVAADSVKVIDVSQVKTWPIENAVYAFTNLYDKYTPDFMVHELYRVYDWKSDEHKWSSVNTVQVIGALKCISLQRQVGWHDQSAQIAKNFCTDDFLRKVNFYHPGLKHGRDAVRHACYYVLFGPGNDK